jgi:hypothetical protein
MVETTTKLKKFTILHSIGVTHCQKSEDVLDDQKTVPFL